MDHIHTSAVSRSSALTIAALWAVGAMTCVALTACDAAAEHDHSALSAAAIPVAAGPAMANATMPMAVSASAAALGAPPPGGSAALYEYRADADPSHAAVASYHD
jgi:hypothetical protein